MQAVGITAALHDTARLLVDNLNLIVIYHIFHIQVKQRVCLQQLVHRVHTLGLHRIRLEQIVFLLYLLLCGQRLVLHSRKLRSDIGKHKEHRIVCRTGEHLYTLVGKFYRMILLVNHKEQRLHGHRHLAVIVSHILGLHLEHKLLHTVLAQIFNQRRILGQSLVHTEQCQTALLLQLLGCERLAVILALVILGHFLGIIAPCGGNLALGLDQQIVGKLALRLDHLMHIGFKLHEHLVIAFRHRTRYDERRTRVVDKHRVNLVDYGVIVVLALHKLGGLRSHIVTQIVETELIISTESDIAAVRVAALLAVGLGLVYTVHRQTVELVQRPHPLRVSLGQIVIHRHHMHALARKGIQEHRQRGHKGLTLARGHLGNVIGHFLAVYHHAVEHLSAYELNVIMHHVPLHEVAAGHPFVLIDSLVAVYSHKILAPGCQLAVGIGGGHLDSVIFLETARRLLYHGKHLGQGRIQLLRIKLEILLLQVINLAPQWLALVILESLYLLARIGYAVFVFLCRAPDIAAYHVDTPAELVIADTRYLCRNRINLFTEPVPERLDSTFALVAE